MVVVVAWSCAKSTDDSVLRLRACLGGRRRTNLKSGGQLGSAASVCYVCVVGVLAACKKRARQDKARQIHLRMQSRAGKAERRWERGAKRMKL